MPSGGTAKASVPIWITRIAGSREVILNKVAREETDPDLTPCKCPQALGFQRERDSHWFYTIRHQPFPDS